jgi:hypothetical protein
MPNSTPSGAAKRPPPTPISIPRPEKGSSARAASSSEKYAAPWRSNQPS